jgi:hypothetical protein
MFKYNIKLALNSMRRNPIMTALMVAAIAVGIGVSMTTLAVFYMMSSNPIPEKVMCCSPLRWIAGIQYVHLMMMNRNGHLTR